MRRVLLYAVLIAPGLIPLIAPYPPFQDWPAHAGLIGLLARASEPAANLGQHFEYIGALKLNSLIYLLGAGLAKIMSPFAAANVVLGLSLASLGPSVAFLCRALRADERAALLSVPLAMGRHTYCGFIPNSAALPLLIVVFALALVLLRREPRWGRGVLLVIAAIALSAAHGFVYLAAAGLLAVLIARYAVTERRRNVLWPAIALVASLLSFAILYARGTGYFDLPSDKSAVKAIGEAILGDRNSSETFWGWLFALQRKTVFDDVVQAAWVLTIAVWILLRRRRSAIADVALLVGITWIAYLILPTYIGEPLYWWAADLRLPPIIALLPLGLCRSVPGWRGLALRSAAFAIAASMLIYNFVDLRRWHREEMAGFEQVVDAIPPGKMISTIFSHQDGNFPGEPEFYFSNYYLLRVGGPVPGTFTDRRDWPFHRKPSVPPHGWGHIHSFRPREHVPLYDGFIVRVPRQPILPGPFGTEGGKLRVLESSGNWAYVAR